MIAPLAHVGNALEERLRHVVYDPPDPREDASRNVSSPRRSASGAACPRPQSDASWIVVASSRIRSSTRDGSADARNSSIIARRRGVPSRHGVHLPHDSFALNASSVLTISSTEAPAGT